MAWQQPAHPCHLAATTASARVKWQVQSHRGLHRCLPMVAGATCCRPCPRCHTCIPGDSLAWPHGTAAAHCAMHTTTATCGPQTRPPAICPPLLPTDATGTDAHQGPTHRPLHACMASTYTVISAAAHCSPPLPGQYPGCTVNTSAQIHPEDPSPLPTWLWQARSPPPPTCTCFHPLHPTSLLPLACPHCLSR
jgi:hypothetical protein